MKITLGIVLTCYLSNLCMVGAGGTAEIQSRSSLSRRTLLAKFRGGLRRGKDFNTISSEASEKIRHLLVNTDKNQGNFFTKENIDIDSTHYTGKWWQFSKASVNEKKCLQSSRQCTKFVHALWDVLPSIKPESWGKCAVVAYGDNLLKIPRGEQIDSHDTVIRLGMVPLTPFRTAAGEKNTFVWIRDRKLRKFKYTFINEDMYGFRASDMELHHLPKALIYNSFHPNLTGGWSVISFGGDLNQNVDLLASKILQAATKSVSAPDPTSGLLLTLTLLYSRYCTYISVFGISTNMGARYWDGKQWDAHKKKLKRIKGKTHTNFNLASNHNTLIETRVLQLLEKMTLELNLIPIKFVP